MALSSSLVNLGVFIAIFGILAIGLNLKFGFTGLLDIGHVAFFLVGAYGTALLVAPPASEVSYSEYVLGLHWPWLPALVVGVVAATVAGMLVALPAIRLREDYLAITLLGVSVIVQRMVRTEAWLANGPRALRGYDIPLRGGFPLPGQETTFRLFFDLSPVRVDWWFLEGSVDLLWDGTVHLTPAVLLGLAVFVVWTVLAYLVGGLLDGRAVDSPGQAVVHGLLLVSTLGVGYLVARRTRRSGRVLRAAAAVAIGALVGLLAGLSLDLVGDVSTLLVFFGIPSVATWVVGGVALARHYSHMVATDYVVAGVFAAGLVGTLLPVVWVGGHGGLLTAVFLGAFLLAGIGWLWRRWERFDGPLLPAGALVLGLVATALQFVWRESTGTILVIGMLLAVFVTAVYWLGTNWHRFDTRSEFISVVGLATVALFAFRYFLLPVVTPAFQYVLEPVGLGTYRSGGVEAGVEGLVQNVLWLLSFEAISLDPATFLDTTEPVFDYQRFKLVLVVGALALAYAVAQLTVNSPFGRVLKAIREDEDVATALGKNVFSYKVQSMMLGSALAGLAGGLFAVHMQSLTYSMFAPRVTFWAFLMVIIGGAANNRGAILGSVVYWGFQKATEDLGAYFSTDMRASIQALRLAVIGALLIIILYYRPEGIWGEHGSAITEGEE